MHDILPLTHPVYFNPRFARQFGVMLGVSVRFAALINAVSDYTRDSLADQYGIDRASIAIVPNAVSVISLRPCRARRPGLMSN